MEQPVSAVRCRSGLLVVMRSEKRRAPRWIEAHSTKYVACRFNDRRHLASGDGYFSVTELPRPRGASLRVAWKPHSASVTGLSCYDQCFGSVVIGKYLNVRVEPSLPVPDDDATILVAHDEAGEPGGSGCPIEGIGQPDLTSFTGLEQVASIKHVRTEHVAA